MSKSSGTFGELVRHGRTLIVVTKKTDHDTTRALLEATQWCHPLSPGHWSPDLNRAALWKFINDSEYTPNGQLLLHASACHGFRIPIDRVLWLGLVPSVFNPAIRSFRQAINRGLQPCPVFTHPGLNLSLDSPLSHSPNHP